MTTAELLAALRKRDVRLWLENDRLRCSAPIGALDQELKAALAGRKQEVTAWLRVAEAAKNGPPAIVPLQPGGTRPPLFAIPGHNGDVFCYLALARRLGADQPLFGVEPPGLDGGEPLRSLEELARYEVEQIQGCRPRGPYLLAGYCAGGTVAFEVARQLTERGEEVALLALFGSLFPRLYRRGPQARLRIQRIAGRAGQHLRALTSRSVPDGLAYVMAMLRRIREQRTTQNVRLDNPLLANGRRVAAATLDAIREYHLRPYPGRIDLFLPSEAWRRFGGRPGQWRAVAGAYRESVGPDDCSLDVILKEPYVAATAGTLRSHLDEIALCSGAALRSAAGGPESRR